MAWKYYNKSQILKHLFILPLLLHTDEKDPYYLVNTKMVGTFFSDTNKPQWENKIILAYEYGGDTKKVRDFFEKSPYKYEKYYDTINDQKYAIFAFVIPPGKKKDFYHLLKGEYTKVSIQTQNKIESTWTGSVLISTLLSDFFLGLTIRHKIQPPLEKDGVLNLNQVHINKGSVEQTLPFLYYTLYESPIRIRANAELIILHLTHKYFHFT